MKINLGYSDDHDFCVSIREHIECGRCSASTLVLWQKNGISDPPRGTSAATFIVDESGHEESVYYLVRCSFFKFNVENPEDITHCEGFKLKPRSS